MTPEEHKNLRTGDRVSLRKHPDFCDFEYGTVTEVGSEGVEITWDSGWMCNSYHYSMTAELITKMFETVVIT